MGTEFERYSGADSTSSGPHSRTRSGVAFMSSRNPNSVSTERTSSASRASQSVKIRSSWRSGDHVFNHRGDLASVRRRFGKLASSGSEGGQIHWHYRWVMDDEIKGMVDSPRPFLSIPSFRSFPVAHSGDGDDDGREVALIPPSAG